MVDKRDTERYTKGKGEGKQHDKGKGRGQGVIRVNGWSIYQERESAWRRGTVKDGKRERKHKKGKWF